MYVHLQKMLSFPVCDLLSEDLWPKAKQCMIALLNDPQVAMTGIKLYSTIFKEAPVNLAVEIYDSLVAHLQEQQKTGADFNSQSGVVLLKKVILGNNSSDTNPLIPQK